MISETYRGTAQEGEMRGQRSAHTAAPSGWRTGVLAEGISTRALVPPAPPHGSVVKSAFYIHRLCLDLIHLLCESLVGEQWSLVVGRGSRCDVMDANGAAGRRGRGQRATGRH